MESKRRARDVESELIKGVAGTTPRGCRFVRLRERNDRRGTRSDGGEDSRGEAGMVLLLGGGRPSYWEKKRGREKKGGVRGTGTHPDTTGRETGGELGKKEGCHLRGIQKKKKRLQKKKASIRRKRDQKQPVAPNPFYGGSERNRGGTRGRGAGGS